MSQLALDLDPPRLHRSAAVATIARTQGDAAIEAGAAKALAIDPAFIDRSCEHMLAYLRKHGTSSGELLTDSCKLAGIKSTDDRHFGAVFQTLLRRGLVRWAGDCRRTKGHATRGGSLYALVVLG